MQFSAKSVFETFGFRFAVLTLVPRGSFGPLGPTGHRGRESARFEDTFHGKFPILTQISPRAVRPNNFPAASRLLSKRIMRRLARAEGVWPDHPGGNLGQNRKFPVGSFFKTSGFPFRGAQFALKGSKDPLGANSAPQKGIRASETLFTENFPLWPKFRQKRLGQAPSAVA